MAGYPLSVKDDRALPRESTEPVFVWDVDKTYLSTRFSSLKHLARIPVEFAVDKRAIPGMPEVLRGLRRGAGPQFACAPLYFISASPKELRGVLEKKMLIDGVDCDGIILKDWAATLKGLRPGRLREQVGFKLCALLTGRLRRPMSTEYLFGDDVEADADSYGLYARLLAGELAEGALEVALGALGVKPDDRRCILDLAGQLGAVHGRVARAFIHLERGSDPRAFDRLGELVVPVRGAYQLALSLFELGLVDLRTVREALAALRATPFFALPDIDDLEGDAVGRGLISREKLRASWCSTGR
jgi:hypothetical protein